MANTVCWKKTGVSFFFLKDDFRDVGGHFYQTCPSSSRPKGRLPHDVQTSSKNGVIL